MPTFDTPDPIAVTIEVGVGHVLITASERSDTVVEIHPSDVDNRDDAIAAEQARVELEGGKLVVKTPKSWRRYSPFSDGGSVDVSIELPAGSQLNGDVAVASLKVSGRLGDTHYATGVGDVRLDDTGKLHVRTGAGDISAGHVGGDAHVTTGTGTLRIDAVDGNAIVKNSNGATWIGTVTGDLRVSAANGTIEVDRAAASAVAKTANGDVRVGEVGGGAIVAESGYGAVEIGVGGGAAAWLDLHTAYGHVESDLDAVDAPGAGDATVEVRARTSYGDITVQRRVRAAR
jgi:DUF4097 and DUF4098 domain-containing protein YvlB